MAAVCDICGKAPGFGKSVSHSHRRTSRRWDPNIQSVRVADRGVRPVPQRGRIQRATRLSKPRPHPKPPPRAALSVRASLSSRDDSTGHATPAAC